VASITPAIWIKFSSSMISNEILLGGFQAFNASFRQHHTSACRSCAAQALLEQSQRFARRPISQPWRLQKQILGRMRTELSGHAPQDIRTRVVPFVALL
jgi:hypothetical protein